MDVNLVDGPVKTVGPRVPDLADHLLRDLLGEDSPETLAAVEHAKATADPTEHTTSAFESAI